jgi:hypothetical protein
VSLDGQQHQKGEKDMAHGTRRVILSLMLAGFLIVPEALTYPAHSQTGCGVTSLSGPYGLQASGIVYGVPTAFVGRFTFDGRGKSTGIINLNLGGEIDTITDVDGTWTIDDGCIGSGVIHTRHHVPPSDHWHDMHLVVVDGGKEALFESGGVKKEAQDKPSAGVVLSGVFKRL